MHDLPRAVQSLKSYHEGAPLEQRSTDEAPCCLQGQPALLYLIPCTLGTVMLLSWCRGDLPTMWQGLDPVELPEGLCKGRLPSIREEDEESDIEHGLLNADQ